MSITKSVKYLILFIIIAIFLRLAPAAFADSTVAINEFVPDASPEWVEFYNASASAEYLKNYYIDDDTSFTDDGGSSAKKLLTNMNTSSSVFPYIELSSMLNNSGDNVVLFDSLGNIIDQYTYSANPGKDISIGRNPDKTGTFFTLASATKGAANSSPQPSATPTPAPSSTPTPTPKPTSTLTPSNTPTPTTAPTSVLPSATANPSPQVLAQTDENPQPEVNLDIIDLTATAESETSPSPTQPPKPGRLTSPVFIIAAAGIALMLAGGIPLFWLEFKSKKGMAKLI